MYLALNHSSTGYLVIDSQASGLVVFKDGGTTYANIDNGGGSDAIFQSIISDGDFLIKGNDGGSVITALTFDMSAGGPATFLSTVTAAGGQLTTTGKALVLGL